MVSGYFFGSSALPWELARIDCEDRGKRLVCLKDEALYNSAVSYLQNTIGSLSTDVWIGLRTYSASAPFTYQWMDNETAVFFDWNSSVGEPNDQEDDFCIRLYKNTLTMGTWLCHDANQYLCEDAPINGNWSTWTAWSDCSSTCGNGSQSRVRYCDSPYPSGGGAFCTGSSSDDQLCHLGDCSVNGMWSVWTGWSDCIQVQCGVSNRTRSRSCDSPVPAGGGSDCVGVATETEGCVNSTCPPGNRKCHKN
ncbi:ectin-like [Crassostrea virginica]